MKRFRNIIIAMILSASLMLTGCESGENNGRKRVKNYKNENSSTKSASDSSEDVMSFKKMRIFKIIKESEDSIINNIKSSIPEVDYEEIYYRFIEEELIPEYGLSELETAVPDNGNVQTRLFEIVSASVYDFCDDGKSELVVVTRERYSDEYQTVMYLHLYQYNGQYVELKDSVQLDNYIIAGGQVHDDMELMIAGNSIYQHLSTSRYASMGAEADTNEYTVIDVSDYVFRKYKIGINILDVSDKVEYELCIITKNYAGNGNSITDAIHEENVYLLMIQ